MNAELAEPRYRLWVAALGMLALSVALHLPSFGHPLLFDDGLLLGHHPDIRDADLLALWTHDYWGGVTEDRNLYRPVTILSFALERAVAGERPALTRALNALLLGVVGLLLVAWCARDDTPPRWLLGAWVVTHLTSASHLTQVVGRSDLLAAAGILGFLVVQRRADADRWTARRALLAMLTAAIAVGSKESGLALAPLAALQAWRGRRVGLLWLAIPLVAYLAARAAVVGGGNAYDRDNIGLLNPLVERGLLERLPGALSVAALYAVQVVWPDPTFHHAPDAPPTWTTPTAWLGAALLLAAAAFAVRAWRRGDLPVALALTWALAHYAIVGNLLRPIGTYAANRLALPFVLAAGALLARPLARGPVVAVVLLLTLINGVRTVSLERAWADEVGATAVDFQRHPDHLVPILVHAKAQIRAGRQQFAIGLIEPLLSRLSDDDPARALAFNLLGRARLDAGQRQAALRDFAAAEVVARRHTLRVALRDALVNTAGAHLLPPRDTDRAAAAVTAAEAVAPEHPKVRVQRAQLHVLDGRFAEAVDHLDPVRGHRDVDLLLESLRSQLVAIARPMTGARADEMLSLAVRADPGHHEAYERRARVRVGMNRRSDAVADYRRAAALHRAAGRLDEANRIERAADRLGQ